MQYNVSKRFTNILIPRSLDPVLARTPGEYSSQALLDVPIYHVGRELISCQRILGVVSGFEP